jgi:RNA-directed DNA polymerase
MKTFNRLFEKIADWDNLLLAAKKAQKGKRYNNSVAAFYFHLEENLLRLQRDLKSKTYQPGPYETFFIHDPKERMISAAPFRDRVVHHALCNIIEPIFENGFIHDSYANRKGKGTHKAIERYQHFAKQNKYVLKCDIRKFFPSIDHAVLKQEIQRKICCRDTLWLIAAIIDNSNPQEEHTLYFPGDDMFTPHERRRGLPIGNLTSQFWANVYLNRFDHFVKEVLKAPGYVRYVDDFVLFSNDKQQLLAWKKELERELAKLRLILHPTKTQAHLTERGVPFLGFRIFPQHRYVRKEKVGRYRRHLRKMMQERQARKLQPQTLEDRLNSWLGHVRFGSNGRLEDKTFRYICQQGVSLHKHPSGSWRVLEQQYRQLPHRQP